MNQEKIGIFINGNFIECDVTNLKIEVQGKVENLSADTINFSNNDPKMVIIGNNNIQISGKNMRKTSISQSSAQNYAVVNIHVTGNVEHIETNIGQVHCKNVKEITSVSGSIRVDGSVDGNISSTSGSINIKGNVTGKVSSVTGSIHMKNMYGDMIYSKK